MTERSNPDLGRTAGEVGTAPPLSLSTAAFFGTYGPQLIEQARLDSRRAVVAAAALTGWPLVVDVGEGVATPFARTRQPVFMALASQGEWAWVGRAR